MKNRWEFEWRGGDTAGLSSPARSSHQMPGLSSPARPVAMIMLMMDTWLKRIFRMYSSPVGRTNQGGGR